MDHSDVGDAGDDSGSECAIHANTRSDGSGDTMVSYPGGNETSKGAILTQTLRIMPYGVTVGALGIIFIIIEIVYIAQRKLVPGIMMLFSFILLVLFIAGIIGTAIQLFAGPNINNQCNTYVFNDDSSGPNVNTLAFLQQRNICKLRSNTRLGMVELTCIQVNAGKLSLRSG